MNLSDEEKNDFHLYYRNKVEEIKKALNLKLISVTGFWPLSNVKIADQYYMAGTTSEAYEFDLLIAKELKRKTRDHIEIVSNIMAPITDDQNYAKDTMLCDKIVVHNIPSQLEQLGPRLDNVLQLRESKYLKEFRKWVSDNHQTIQQSEIDEMQRDVQHQVDEYIFDVFYKEIDKMSNASVVLTESKTIFDVAIGSVPVVSTLYSLTEASAKTVTLIEEKQKYNTMRCSGFIAQTKQLGQLLKEKNLT